MNALNMTLEEFTKDLEERLAKTSDEELIEALRRAGCKFKDDEEDTQSQQDYKNSLKNSLKHDH